MKDFAPKNLRKWIGLSATRRRSDYIRTLERTHEELELQNQSLIQAQFEIELSRERYADFFDTAPVCFVTLTRTGIIRELNLPALRLLTMKNNHLTGWPFINFIADDDRKVFLAHLSRCRDNFDPTHPMSVELQLKRGPNANPAFIKLISTPTPSKNAKDIVYKSIFMDVTDQKKAEKELQESLAREKAAREVAEAANRAKNDFLAALSHELRTPLNPVLLVSSDAAANRDLPPGVRASFDMVRRNIELEARLIDDLLDLTHMAAGKLKFEKNPVDVHAILKKTIALLQSEMDHKKIVLKQKFEAVQTIISGDSIRLQQIFWNVLKNAVKFTPPKGTVTVQTCSADKDFSILISDTGIGMTAEELERAFEAFAQGEHSKDIHRFGGLGLGLNICQKMVGLHSGTIEASSPGRDCGSTITIKFPLATANEQVAKSAKPVSLLRQPQLGIRILLVEDHEPTRTALGNLLARRRHNVKMAVSVHEALALAKKSKFDVVISDIGLPDGNGYDLFKKLRKKSPVKGIALTGYGMSDDIARSQDAGFTTHLTKPVRMESLDHALVSVFGN